MIPVDTHRTLRGIQILLQKGLFPLAAAGALICILSVSWVWAADSREDISIASIFAKTGPMAPAHRSSAHGVRMAVDEINATGGVLGRRLDLVEIDNFGTPIGSKVAADKAVQQGVAAIIGPAFSTQAIAVAKVAQANRVPMIAAIATHPGITATGDYIFRVCFTDRLQGAVMGRFARQQLKARGVVITVNLNSDYSISLSSAFEREFIRLGGRVLAKLPYTPRQTNFRDLVAKAAKEDPDVLFVPGHDESARIVVDAMESGLRAIPLGGDGWDHETFFSRGGDRIEEAYYTTHWHPELKNTRSMQFMAHFDDAEVTLTAAALAYDAVCLVADAIRRAGSVRRAAIRDALAATRDFLGVTGRLKFDANGDPEKNVIIMKIQDGTPVYYRQETFTEGNP